MSNQSDRIRAALSKSDVPKSSGESGGPLPSEERPVERPAEAETSRHPSIALNDEVLEALLRPGPATRRPLFENMQDVESSLGMLAKNDQTRAAAPSAVATPPVSGPVSKIEQPAAKSAPPAVEKPAAPVTEKPIEKSQPAPVSPAAAPTVSTAPKTDALISRDSRPAATILKPAPKPAASEAKDPAPLKASLPVNDKILEKVEALHATFGTLEQPKRESSKLPLIIGAVVLIAGLSAFFLRGHFATAKAPVTAAAPAFPLQLELQPQANGMINIRWNPDTPPVTNAREGRMVITERDQASKTVPLEIAQLKMGHLYFQTSSDRVEFRLEVVDHSGAITQESVMALSSGTPADATAGATPQAQNAAASAAKPQNNAQGVANSQAPAGPVPAAAAPKAPIRTFTMPPPATSASQEGRVILPDAPVISGAVTGGAAVSPAVRLPDAGAAPPAPRSVPAAAQPIRVGGGVQNANLIRRVTPVYPEMALRARVQGTVRFSAVIGKGGAIQNLQLISGPSLLVQSAVDAVKQWVYRPTMLNGEPVEVITQIEVNFTLAK